MSTEAKPRKKRNYVSKKSFAKLVIEHNEAVSRAVSRGETPPQISKELSEIFMKIAQRLATKKQFRGYSYIEDMIADGYEDCLRRIYNFNPEMSSYVFAYFTQIIWNAFIRKIKNEKKLLQTTIALTEHYSTYGITHDKQIGDDRYYNVRIEQTEETLEYF